MVEKPSHFKNETAPYPNLLDVVKIDELWRQVIGMLNPKSQLVRFLKTNTCALIDFREYKLSKRDALTCRDLLRKGLLSNDEFQYVMWDPDNIGKGLAKKVLVFGELTKIKKEVGT